MENSKQSAFACASQYGVQKGLTKREYFAAIALQGVLSHNHPMNPTPNDAEPLVKYAIGLADELLNQLEK